MNPDQEVKICESKDRFIPVRIFALGIKMWIEGENSKRNANF